MLGRWCAFFPKKIGIWICYFPGSCTDFLVFLKQDSFHATFTLWRQRHGGHQKMSNLRKAGKDQKTWVMKINDGLSKSVLEKYPEKHKKIQCECTTLSLKNRNFLTQILEHTNKDRTKTRKHPSDSACLEKPVTEVSLSLHSTPGEVPSSDIDALFCTAHCFLPAI